MKRHVIVSICLLLVLYNLIGFMAAFQAIRFEWRQSVRAELAEVAEENLVRFVFSKNDAAASKNEFKLNGKYYDVVRKEIKGDSVVIDCFDDATETRLTTKFSDLIIKNETQNPDYQHKTQLCFQLLIKDFYFPSEKTHKEGPSVSSHFGSVFFFKNRFFPLNYTSTDTPPPNTVAAKLAS
jgi:hypothetical protein